MSGFLRLALLLCSLLSRGDPDRTHTFPLLPWLLPLVVDTVTCYGPYIMLDESSVGYAFWVSFCLVGRIWIKRIFMKINTGGQDTVV